MPVGSRYSGAFLVDFVGVKWGRYRGFTAFAGTNCVTTRPGLPERFVSSNVASARQSPTQVWCQASRTPGTVAEMSMPPARTRSGVVAVADAALRRESLRQVDPGGLRGVRPSRCALPALATLARHLVPAPRSSDDG